jgi:hypothetical protein
MTTYEIKKTRRGAYITSRCLECDVTIGRRMDGTDGLCWDGDSIRTGDKSEVEAAVVATLADGQHRTVTCRVAPVESAESKPQAWITDPKYGYAEDGEK